MNLSSVNGVWSRGPVRIVGTGLLGTSIGLALRLLNVDVSLSDASPGTLALARDLGAGRIGVPGDAPALVVVATPPDVTAAVVTAELAAFPDAVVTDVASVKARILRELREAGADTTRYVGSHPMAGRERSGAVAARGDLFVGRPWVLTEGDGSAQAHAIVRDLALTVGSIPVSMAASAHDEAVAMVSHVPQVAASLVAARLLGAQDDAVALAGQGLRDVTRIAASDPGLWVQILTGNAAPVAQVLREIADDLDHAVRALEQLAVATPGPDSAPGARAQLARMFDAGNRGHDLIPGKHGAPVSRYEVVTVVLADRPGELGRLFNLMGEADINVEEIRLEHVPGRMVGLVEVSVIPSSRERFESALAAAGWETVG